MTDMTRENALERIRKCLALSKSSNPNEAATALRQAQKLMEKFDVDFEDATAPRVDVLRVSPDGKRGAGWQAVAAATVAKALGLRAYRERGSGRDAFVFYGNAERVKLADFAFVNLSRAVVRGRAAHLREMRKERPWYNAGDMRRVGRSFALGFVSSVYDAVQGLVESPAETRAIEEWTKSRGIALRKAGRLSAADAAGFNAGQAAGAAYHVNRPMGGASHQRIAA